MSLEDVLFEKVTLRELIKAVGKYLEAHGPCDEADDYQYPSEYPYCPYEDCEFCVMTRVYDSLGRGEK